MNFRWEEQYTKRGHLELMWLYAGGNPEPLATLDKRAKYWEAVIWLPGVSPRKQYAPLEDQQADVEERIRQWFLLCEMRP